MCMYNYSARIVCSAPMCKPSHAEAMFANVLGL